MKITNSAIILTEAEVWDSVAYNAPFHLIVKSSGNNRNQTGLLKERLSAVQCFQCADRCGREAPEHQQR